jgi:hypothetical protein
MITLPEFLRQTCMVDLQAENINAVLIVDFKVFFILLPS